VTVWRFHHTCHWFFRVLQCCRGLLSLSRSRSLSSLSLVSCSRFFVCFLVLLLHCSCFALGTGSPCRNAGGVGGRHEQTPHGHPHQPVHRVGQLSAGAGHHCASITTTPHLAVCRGFHFVQQLTTVTSFRASPLPRAGRGKSMTCCRGTFVKWYVQSSLLLRLCGCVGVGVGVGGCGVGHGYI